MYNLDKIETTNIEIPLYFKIIITLLIKLLDKIKNKKIKGTQNPLVHHKQMYPFKKSLLDKKFLLKLENKISTLVKYYVL